MMEGLFVNLVEQFQNLFDPSTALGAFLISLASGIVVSFLGGFFSGRSYQKKIDKENSIEVQKAGEILQDIRKESTGILYGLLRRIWCSCCKVFWCK